MHHNYVMLIVWSEVEQAFLVQFPEFESFTPWVCKGASYEEAAKKGQEVLKLHLANMKDLMRPLPVPVTPETTWMYFNMTFSNYESTEPTLGQLYVDSTHNRLMQWNGSKWVPTATVIAQAVKQYLISLAIEDELPLDLNQLDIYPLQKAIEDAIAGNDKENI